MTEYSIHTEEKFAPLEVVDVGRLADECPERWWNQTLCHVNDCVARVGVGVPFEGLRPLELPEPRTRAALLRSESASARPFGSALRGVFGGELHGRNDREAVLTVVPTGD